MPSVIASSLNDLPIEIRHALGTFRYQVFVQRLGWSLPDINDNTDTEWDQFDGENTVQVVALASRHRIWGCARLMPTTGPYLLQKLLPRSSGIDLPASPTVWEFSRFAASSGKPTDVASGMQFFPYALSAAASLGATRVVGVVTRAVARLYRRFGLDLQSLGPFHEQSELPYLACAIDLTPLTFTNLGSDLGDLRASITWLGSCTPITPREIGADRHTRSSIDNSSTCPRVLANRANPCAADAPDSSNPTGIIATAKIAVPLPRGDDAGCPHPSPNPV